VADTNGSPVLPAPAGPVSDERQGLLFEAPRCPNCGGFLDASSKDTKKPKTCPRCPTEKTP
jgi:predicted Zn-ribbon and HTH transcriptional regulator